MRRPHIPESVLVTGAVSELWRYPIKSLLGERLQEAHVDERGIVGDRLFAVTDRNGKIGSGKATRRFRRLDGLFELHARTEDERPIVTLPGGRELCVGDPSLDTFLSEHYGDELRVVVESTVPHHDAAPLHLLTTASLRWLQDKLPGSAIDRRRFRPNILVNAAGSNLVEDEWVSARLRLGTAIVRVIERCERCVMTTNVQSDLPQDPAVLRSVSSLNQAFFGVYASVEEPGIIRIGDELLSI